MSISLVNVFKHYKSLPHQDEAIQYIQDALEAGGMKHWLSSTSEFVQTWRNNTSPSNDISPVSLVNVAKHYKGFPHQQEALAQLQEIILTELPDLFDETSEFAQLWNNRRNEQSPTPQSGWLISFESIGLAKLGMPLEDLKLELGTDAQFQTKSPFMGNFDAIAVTIPGDHKALYYIVYPSGTALEDSDEITMLITDNPKFRTAEGIGPGVLVSKAVEVYGDPTFSYRPANESREFVRFADTAHNNAANSDSSRKFLPQALSYDFAGIYQNPTGESNETKEFQENASIWQVWLIKTPTDIELPIDGDDSNAEADVAAPSTEADATDSSPEIDITDSSPEIDITD
nr:hypothetical protein [Leptolyngbyaceae cyanobacterium MO_188.B28]